MIIKLNTERILKRRLSNNVEKKLSHVFLGILRTHILDLVKIILDAAIGKHTKMCLVFLNMNVWLEKS